MLIQSTPTPLTPAQRRSLRNQLIADALRSEVERRAKIIMAQRAASSIEPRSNNTRTSIKRTMRRRPKPLTA